MAEDLTNGSRRIRVIKPGPQNTIQDCGRTGFQSLGVSVSGAADIESLRIGNRLVGNEPCAAGLEITFGTGEFEFTHPTVFALTGAETTATLDGAPVGRNVRYQAHAGARLVFGISTSAIYAYLAVAGGFNTRKTLGSRSTHTPSGIGGANDRPLVVDEQARRAPWAIKWVGCGFILNIDMKCME